MLSVRRAQAGAALALAMVVAGAATTWGAVQSDSSSTAQTPDYGQSTSAVADVQPEIRDHFALFRNQPPASMPDAVLAQIGSPKRFGRNGALARAVKTVTGIGWVIPGDGYVCVAIPDPVDGYGTSCAPTDLAVQRGVAISLGGNLPNGRAAAELMLVPDGAEAVVHTSDGDQPVPATDGVASVYTDNMSSLRAAW